MHGVPARLQTREDYERVHVAGLVGEVDRLAAIRHLEGLLSGRWDYQFDRYLDEGEAPDGEAPEYIVLEQEDGRRRQERRVYAQGATIEILGYSESEVLAKIAELQEV
ncbi:hypothetical protein [Desulfobulbus propionicus]